MKRFSSILLAALVATLMLVSNLRAQTITGVTGLDWQNPTSWGTPTFPGQDASYVTATIRLNAAGTISNVGGVPNRVARLVIDAATVGVATLNGTGTLRVGTLVVNSGTASVLTIGPGLTIIVDSLITGISNLTAITLSPGATLQLTGTFANAFTPGGPQITSVAGATSSKLILGAGYNNGIFPVDLGVLSLINPAFAGEIELQGNSRLQAVYTRAVADGRITLSNNAQLRVAPGQTLTLNQTAIGSLQGNGTIQGEVGGLVALGAGFNGGNLPGANFANPFFGTIRFLGATNLTSNFTLGAPNGTAAQQGVMDLNVAAAVVTVTPGVTLTLNSTEPNSLTGLGFLAAQVGGTIVLGPNFNNGIIPARFRAIEGTLQTQGAFSLTSGSPQPLSPLATTGTLRLGGNLNLIGAGTVIFSNSAPNSLVQDNPNAKITAQGANTFVAFGAGFNNGIIPGRLFSKPFTGGIYFLASATIQDSLHQATDGGTWFISNHGTVLTIAPGAEVGLFRTTAPAINGTVDDAAFPGPVATGSLGAWLNAPSSYFQGVNSTSVLRVGLGFNGGNIPQGLGNIPYVAPGTVAFPGGTAPAITGRVVVPFLPLPTTASVTVTTAGQTLAFKGKLVIEGSMIMQRDLRIDAVGALELRGGNLTIGAGNLLELFNQGANSLSGTGVIQAEAANQAAVVAHPFALFELPTNVAFTAAATPMPGKISFGPSFNAGIIPAARFANPFLGTVDVSASGPVSGIAPLTIQGDFVSGIEGGVNYFMLGRRVRVAANDFTQRYGNILIGQNSSLRLNGVNLGSLWDGNVAVPGPSVPGTIQGTDVTSRLILGQGFNGFATNTYYNNAAVVATAVYNVTGAGTWPVAAVLTTQTTSATFLAAPFNGSLEFLNQAVLNTSATIGVTGRLVLAAPLSLTTSTVRDLAGAQLNPRWGYRYDPGAALIGPNATVAFADINVAGSDNRVNVRYNAANVGEYLPVVLTLNNQAANSLTGDGYIQVGTGNTVELGAGFNAGILPGTRFNPGGVVGTMATAGPLRLTGILTIGSGNDAAIRRLGTGPVPAAMNPLFVSSGFLKLGATLTVDNGAVLNVSNATVNAFTGPGVVDAEPTGQVNIIDGFNGNWDKNYNAPAGFSPNQNAGAVAAVANQLIIPTRSNLDATNFASPFRGRLGIGAGLAYSGQSIIAANTPTSNGVLGQGGVSRVNITNGTLTMGPTSQLILNSPLFVSSATSVAPPGGFPRLVLNMTGSNSLIGVTSGSVLNSSTGSYLNNNIIFPNNQAAFRVTGGGGQIVFGAGFNASQIPANRFARPFSGELVLPNSGTFDVIGDLTMLSPSLSTNAAGGGAPWTVTPVDFGLLNLGSGSAILRVADGASLSLSTAANVNAAGANYTSPDGVTTPIFSVAGTGKIVGATNNATIRVGATYGGFSHIGAAGASVSAVTAATFVQPFVGRLVIVTQATNAVNNPVGGATLNGSFTLGASGSTDGVLDIVNASGTVFVGSGSNLQINNTSPVSTVLPGAGRLNAVDNTASITIGPSALTNVLPGSRLQNPFVGQLITAPGTTPLTLDANFILAGDNSTINTDDAINGILNLNAPLRMLSGVTLGFNNFRPGAFIGAATGQVIATDQTSVVRLCVGFNGYVIPGNRFSNPWNGTILGNWHDPAGTPIVPLNPHATLAMNGTEFGDYAAGYAPTANAVGGAGAYYHLIGNLTLGAANSSNGFLDLRGNPLIAATYPINGDLFLSSTDGTVGGAGTPSGTIDKRGTTATLTVNNILPVAQVLPGSGLLQSRGREKNTGLTPNGLPAASIQLNHFSSNLIFGANGLNNIFPAAKLGPISGNVFTPASPVTADAGNILFAGGGTLVVGGTTATVGTGASLTIPAGNTYTFTTEHARALTGIGQLLAGSTSSTISFGRGATPVATNQGEIPASNIGPHFGGQLVVQDATVMTLRNGQLRLGDGTGSSGRFQIGTTVGAGAGAQLVIGTNATLDLRQQNPNVIMVGSQLITAQDSTSKLILGPSFNLSRFQAETNPAGGGVMSNLVGTPFMGVLITSTGSLTLNNSLTIGASLPIWINGPTGLTASQTPVAGGPSNLPRGGLELGGELIIPQGVTLTYSATTATSLRGTLGSAGYININPAANGATPPAAGYGEFIFNGSALTNNAAAAPANAGIVPTQLFGIRALNVTGVTRATVGFATNTARLTVNLGNYEIADGNVPVVGTASTGLNMFGDLRVNTRTRLNIPRNSTVSLATAFVPVAINTTGFQTDDATNRGAVTATDSTGTLRFVQGLVPNTTAPIGSGPAGTSELNTFTPTIGSGATGFQGRLLLDRNVDVNAITVTMGTASIFENNFNVVLTGAAPTLNLNNQGATTFRNIAGTTVGFVSSTSTTARVNLGAGFNAGFLPGDRFGANTAPRSNPFQGRITIASDQTLTSRLNIGSGGGFDFGTGTAKLIVGTFGATDEGELLNAGSTRYFVTNSTGYAGLGQVGNVTFPVGPSTTLYTPLFVANNAAPSIFGVRANTPITPIVLPAAATGSAVPLSSVGIRWSVEQRNNIAAGIAVALSPQWPTSQEGSGFNRTIAVVNRYTGTASSQTSVPSQAAAVPGLTNYFQSSIVVSQTAAPGALTTSTELVVTSQPTPAIVSFTPTAASSSQTVTIVGQRFVGVTAVRFGGTNAVSFTVTAAGDTIRAVVGQGTSGPVSVVQAGGTATSTTNFTYLGAPPQTPVLIYARPQPLSAGLGDVQMTITGTGFGNNTVRIVASGSGAQGTIVPTSNSATTITFTLPGQFSRNVGSVTLTVTSIDKNPVSTNVTVAVAPATTLASITPSTTSGNLMAHTVFVTGTAFGPQSTFSLNGTSLRLMSFVTNTNGTLTAGVEIPVGAVSGNVVVTNLNNTTAQLPFSITNLPRPIITGVSPAAIAPGSGDRLITVQGLNLIPGAVVTFNGVAIGNVTTTTTSVQFVVPASLLASPDLATIRITNPDNQSIGYRFPISNGLGEAPVISVDPNTGRPLSGVVTPATTNATAQAFQLVINGTNFGPNITVSFGGTPVQVTRIDSTRLVVNIPGSLNVAGMFQVQLANSVNGGVVGFPYTIGPRVDPPAITSVRGDATNIVITGDNFRAGATVQLGSTVLTVVSIEAGRIVVNAPRNLMNGTYTLVVTNTDGQFATQLYQYVNPFTSVKERFAGTRMYPNPTVDVVNVEATLERSAEVVITITNTLGQKVMTVRQNAAAGFFAKSVSIQNLPTGAYTVEITDGTRRSVEKIIKN